MSATTNLAAEVSGLHVDAGSLVNAGAEKAPRLLRPTAIAEVRRHPVRAPAPMEDETRILESAFVDLTRDARLHLATSGGHLDVVDSLDRASHALYVWQDRFKKTPQYTVLEPMRIEPELKKAERVIRSTRRMVFRAQNLRDPTPNRGFLYGAEVFESTLKTIATCLGRIRKDRAAQDLLFTFFYLISLGALHGRRISVKIFVS